MTHLSDNQLIMSGPLYHGSARVTLDGLTLNQRVHSSSLCAPTIKINDLSVSCDLALCNSDHRLDGRPRAGWPDGKKQKLIVICDRL